MAKKAKSKSNFGGKQAPPFQKGGKKASKGKKSMGKKRSY